MPGQPTRPKDAPYHHGNLRNALIAEGRNALEEIGTKGLSLRYLARAVGVSEAAPSRHFTGKEALLAAIAADGFRELTALRSVIYTKEESAAARAYCMMTEYVAFARAHKGLFDLMVGPRIVARTPYTELNDEGEKSFQMFASAVKDYAVQNKWEKKSLPLVVHAAWAMEHGLATLILGDRVPRAVDSVSVDKMIHFAISMFLGAVSQGPEQLEDILRQLPIPKRTTG